MQRKWERHRLRDRMRHQGTESAHDELPPLMAPLIRKRRPYGPRPSKADLRAETAVLIEQFHRSKNSTPA
jgi:hypothetical protein